MSRVVVARLWKIKDEVVGGGWGKLLQDAQVGIGIVTAAQASDNQSLGVGEALDDAPGMELVVVGHGKLEQAQQGRLHRVCRRNWDQSESSGVRQAKVTRRLTGAKCL